MRVAIALLLACATTLPVSASPSLDPLGALKQGKIAYLRQEYGKVVENVYPLLYPSIELSTEDDVVEAHRLLGLSYYFLDKKPDAEREVSALLALRPTYELSPIVNPPVAVAFFNTVRERQAERLQELRRREQEEAERARKEEARRAAEARARAERIYIEKQIVRRSRLVALLPFGIGQVQNGERGKAIAFGTTQAVFGAASLASWIALGQLYPNGRFPSEERMVFEALNGLQLAAGAAFWGMVIWGIVDAQVKLVPETVIEREVKPGKKHGRVTVTPLVSPGRYGLGFGGVF